MFFRWIIPNPSPLRVDGTTIENEFFRVRIDPTTGCVTSLIDKSNNKETVAPGGHGDLLQTFVDKPPVQDAWSVRFNGKSWNLTHPQEVKIIERGPERAVIEIKNKFQDSNLVRDVVVHPDVPRIDIHMKVNWNEHPHFDNACRCRAGPPQIPVSHLSALLAIERTKK